MRLSKRGTVPDEATALASLRRQDGEVRNQQQKYRPCLLRSRALASLQSSITGIYRAEDEQQGEHNV